MKTEPEKTNKSFIQKNPWIIIPFILVMGYLVFTNYSSLKAKREKNDAWNDEDYKVMVDQCMVDLKEMAVKNPEISREYCDCSMKRIQAAISKRKYNETMEKSIPEQTDILLPIFQECLTEYQNKLKGEETAKE